MRKTKQVMKHQILTAVLCAAVASAGLLACGGGTSDEEAIVAEVGDREIELRRITDYVTALHVDYPTPEAELQARRRRLNELIEEQLLIIGGYSRALDADIGIVELVDREKDKFLLDELYRHEVIDKSSYTEDDVQEMYSHWFDRVNIRHIAVETKEKADSVLAKLEAGASFSDLAEEYSIDRSTAVRGGSFGREFRWTELAPSMREPVFDLAESELSDPLETDFGWHIVQMVSRRQAEQQPLEEVRTTIERNLERSAQEERRIEQLEQVRETAGIEFDPAGLETFRALVQETIDTVAGVPRSRRNIPIDSLDTSVRDQTLATYATGGSVTVGQVVERFNSIPWDARTSQLTDEEQLREVVFQLSLFDLLRAEALRLRMDEQPLYEERLQEFHEQLIADKMREMIISQNLRITEADMRAYYEAHPDSFISPKAYHVREVMVHDSSLANKIVQMAYRGTSLEELARQYTERTGFKSQGGDIGWVRPDRYPDLYKAASRLEIGEIGGPYSGVDQHSIIEVLEVQPAKQRTFEDVQQSLFNKMQKMLTDSILTAYKDSMAAQHPVVIHEDVLRSGLDLDEAASG